MTTDNRTNEPTAEQIVSETLGPYGLIGRARDLAARNAVERLRANGLLSEGAPSEAQARAIRKLDNVQAILAGAQASVTDAVRELSLTSAALTAAQGAARPVNGFDTTAERVKNGADSVHVAPVLPSSGVDEDDRSLSAWPTVDEVRETFKKSADRLAFDRWLTAVERAAAGKALTEAADELALLDDGGKRGLAGHSKSSASAITHRHAVAVIRARAEAYTEGRLT